MIDGITPPQRRFEETENQNQGKEDGTEPAFRPPEAVAIAAAPTSSTVLLNEALKPGFAKEKATKKRPRIITWFTGLKKPQKIALIVALIILISGSGVAAFKLLNKPAPKVATPAVAEKEPEPPKPVIYYSPLSGVAVSKEQSELPVTGIMVENSPDARPQAGLNQAGVVFEAIAEGGITRFLTLFQENQPDYVGPVRSVRPYYVDWLQGFDAAIAHVGGSGEALAKIRNEGVKDLDQSANSGPFRRVSNRYAPHNMYTSLGGLIDLSKSKGWTTSTFTSFPRKPAAPAPAPAITAKTVDIIISSALYNLHYDYDPVSNTYKRSMGGKPHLDERSKEQLSPSVVIAMVIPYGIHPNRIHSTYQTIGSGKAVIFQDGVAAEGTWEKASPKAQIIYKDAAGKPIPLNPGQTWVTATSIANNIVYKP